MQKRIGVDIDGVISDIARHIIDYSAREFACLIAPEQISSDRMETCTELTQEQLIIIFTDPKFWKTLPVVPSSHEWLRRIREFGWEVILVTDRFWYPQIEEDTRDWLASNDIPFDDLEFARRAEKPTRARDLGITMFVEDQLSNANTLAEVCETVFLVDRTYNQGSTASNVHRIINCLDCLSTL